jgi:hypothetical protein
LHVELVGGGGLAGFFRGHLAFPFVVVEISLRFAMNEF